MYQYDNNLSGKVVMSFSVTPEEKTWSAGPLLFDVHPGVKALIEVRLHAHKDAVNRLPRVWTWHPRNSEETSGY
jgi:hypothetical protein